MIEGKLPHLVGGGLHQAFIIKAEGCAPQPRHGFDILLALIVKNTHALAAADHQRAIHLMRLGIGIGVQHIGNVADGIGIAGRGHVLASSNLVRNLIKACLGQRPKRKALP